jgi:simple sugar transport system ATP-binding protein
MSPTRGIDVGAHAEVLRLINEMVAGGMSLLVISSELEELVAVSDRIIVVRDRRHVAELTGPASTRMPLCAPLRRRSQSRTRMA